MKHNDYHRSKTSSTKAVMCLLVLGLMNLSLGCAARARTPVTETGGILKMVSIPLKDGGHAEIQFQKLRSTFLAGWSGRFQGAGGHPEGEVRHFYLVVAGTVKMASGRTAEFTWIGPYMKHWTSPYIIPERLVFVGSDIFIEYAAVQTSPDSTCADVVKYKKYKGPRTWDFDDLNGPLAAYRTTYKWPAEYVWEDVTKEAFEHAAGTGDVVSLDSNWRSAHDVCYDWNDTCFKRCLEGLGGLRMTVRKFYDQIPFKVEEAENTLNDHPEIIHSWAGRTALHQAIEALDPKRPVKKENRDKARRMLVLLYRYNADVNAVDFKTRTPLQVAVELNVERDIVDDLVRRGGRILYPPCGFRETVLARFPEFAKKEVIREVDQAEGWIDDDAFQVWVEKKGRYVDDLNAAEERFIRELGLGPRKEVESDAELKIFSLIVQREPVCRRKDPASGQEQWLARIAYPGLRDLLSQYHKIKSTPFP